MLMVIIGVVVDHEKFNALLDKLVVVKLCSTRGRALGTTQPKYVFQKSYMETTSESTCRSDLTWSESTQVSCISHFIISMEIVQLGKHIEMSRDVCWIMKYQKL